MQDNPNEQLKYLKTLVLLQLHGLTGQTAAAKPEMLLARAGLNSREIAELLGKNPGAVAKSLQRAAKGDA